MRIFTLLIFLTGDIFAQKPKEANILEKFLEDDQKAYAEIINSPEKYKDLILMLVNLLSPHFPLLVAFS